MTLSVAAVTGNLACVHAANDSGDASLEDSLPLGSVFAEGKANWEQQLIKFPKNAGVHTDYARFLLSAGLIDTAIAEFQRAVELNPKESDALIELAEISLQNLDFERAKNYAQQALKVSPGSSEARIVLLTAFVQSDKINEAEKQLNLLLSTESRNPRVLQLAYMVKVRLGDLNQARTYLQKAVSLQPGKIDWVLELCKMLESSGNANLAYEQLQGLLQKYPNSVDARLRLARNLEMYRHNYDGAIEEYIRALEIDQKSEVALSGIERCKGKKNDLALRLKQNLQSWLQKKN